MSPREPAFGAARCVRVQMVRAAGFALLFAGGGWLALAALTSTMAKADLRRPIALRWRPRVALVAVAMVVIGLILAFT